MHCQDKYHYDCYTLLFICFLCKGEELYLTANLQQSYLPPTPRGTPSIASWSLPIFQHFPYTPLTSGDLYHFAFSHCCYCVHFNPLLPSSLSSPCHPSTTYTFTTCVFYIQQFLQVFSPSAHFVPSPLTFAISSLNFSTASHFTLSSSFPSLHTIVFSVYPQPVSLYYSFSHYILALVFSTPCYSSLLLMLFPSPT